MRGRTVLRTQRLMLRPWEESDAEMLYEYAKDPRVGPACGWEPHTSVENSREIIRTVFAEEETFAIVPDAVGHAVGSLGIMREGEGTAPVGRDEAEIGYWIGVPYWGQGLVPEAVREALRYCFETLGCSGVWCGYFDGNDKSRRVQEKCGFVYHHTERDKEWRGMRITEHCTFMSRAQWEKTRAVVGENADAPAPGDPRGASR